MNEALIEVKNIKKTYFRKQDSIEVLRDISFSIRKNESLSITGPSGAGKTTLLHIIAGLQEPTAGQVLFENKSIHAFTEKEIARFRNQRIGFVFQFYHLIEELDVVENVMLPAMVYSQDTALVLRQRAGHLLESLELGKRKDFFPSQLSGGEKQRVAIARALMNKPPLLLCDEPTGNLDFNSAERIIQLLFALKKAENVTLVIVTHNPDLAKKTDRSIHIKNGIITS